MEASKEKVLRTPIEQLDLNADCKSNLTAIGIDTLQQFIDKGWTWLRQQKDFDYIRFNMVIKYLDENGLLHLLERKK